MKKLQMTREEEMEKNKARRIEFLEKFKTMTPDGRALYQRTQTVYVDPHFEELKNTFKLELKCTIAVGVKMTKQRAKSSLLR